MAQEERALFPGGGSFAARNPEHRFLKSLAISMPACAGSTATLMGLQAGLPAPAPLVPQEDSVSAIETIPIAIATTLINSTIRTRTATTCEARESWATWSASCLTTAASA